jgi:hypothetical protein
MHLTNLINFLVTKMIAHSSNNTALSVYPVVNALVSLAGRWVAAAPSLKPEDKSLEPIGRSW